MGEAKAAVEREWDEPMAQDYDVSLKLLFHHSRGLVAQRLFGGPVVEWVDIEQPKVTNIRVDLLARLADGSLRHVELQKKNEADIGRRQAEYYVGFHRLLTPVWETPSMRHKFIILDIRDFDGEPLVASEDWGDNILALLTRVDQERVLQRVQAQLRQLKGEEQETAARLLVIVSGIIGLEQAVVERLHMIDIMENKVLGPAIRMGEAKMLKMQLEERFGPLPGETVLTIDGASQDEMLLWGKRILRAASLAEVFARP